MRVLMTGASGGIGTRLRQMLPAIYPDLVLSDITPPPDLQPHERFVQADLSDLAAVERACEGIDGILHFGGFSVEGPWETILSANIVGCYNLFEAARRQKVGRVVFASSNHAMGFYPRSQTVGVDLPVRPDSRYGVSKAFGEAMGALYSYKHGLRVLSLRIGNFGDVPVDERRLAIWLHPDDLVQLCRIGLEHPDLYCEIMYGASDNARGWWDNSNARRFGYEPKHRSEDYAADAMAAQAKLPPEPIGDLFQGGPFCTAEYDGDAHLRART